MFVFFQCVYHRCLTKVFGYTGRGEVGRFICRFRGVLPELDRAVRQCVVFINKCCSTEIRTLYPGVLAFLLDVFSFRKGQACRERTEKFAECRILFQLFDNAELTVVFSIQRRTNILGTVG